MQNYFLLKFKRQQPQLKKYLFVRPSESDEHLTLTIGVTNIILRGQE
ncbi:hypothetical protein [Chroococcidiopsis sp. SAG 2025]|nr:hypothetical protein [Chroococcidiopsis sp. SAG 2025]